MSDHFNGLSPAEAERLAILSEECGEIIQIIGKILRHGFNSYNPLDAHAKTDTGEGMSNRDNLCREIGDFDAICKRMLDNGDIYAAPIREASERKHKKLKRWTHHQSDSEYVP